MAAKTVLMVIAYIGYQPLEYTVPKKILEQQGFRVVTASNKAGTATAKDGSKATVDITVADANAADYAAIILVGGSGAMDNLDNKDTYELVQDAAEHDKLIGAICVAPRILAKAGVLANVAATGWDGDEKLNSIFDEYDAKRVQAPVVVDVGIITADGPPAAQEFGQEIARLLKAGKHHINP